MLRLKSDKPFYVIPKSSLCAFIHARPSLANLAFDLICWPWISGESLFQVSRSTVEWLMRLSMTKASSCLAWEMLEIVLSALNNVVCFFQNSLLVSFTFVSTTQKSQEYVMLSGLMDERLFELACCSLIEMFSRLPIYLQSKEQTQNWTISLSELYNDRSKLICLTQMSVSCTGWVLAGTAMHKERSLFIFNMRIMNKCSSQNNITRWSIGRQFLAWTYSHR